MAGLTTGPVAARGTGAATGAGAERDAGATGGSAGRAAGAERAGARIASSASSDVVSISIFVVARRIAATFGLS